MSLKHTLWASWAAGGYWLHVYRSVAAADYGRRYLVLESNRSGKTYPMLALGGGR